MSHAYYRPRAPLDELVDFFWFSDRHVSSTPRERVLPTSSAALVVHLGDSPMRVYDVEDAADAAEFSGAVLCGARSSPLVIGTALGPTVGIHFKPGGARPFFDVPADALADRAVPLEALWGASARVLHERLSEAPTSLVRVQRLEEIVLERMRRPSDLRAVLHAALAAFEEPDLPSVAEVNQRTGLSPKRLLSLFRDEVGLSPKAYWRVRRFRAALREVERGALRGAAVAAEHGYFDQAHFLREFRALAGSSPREYLAARVAGTGHVSVRG
ncbi:Transcriptional regulator, AraC family protein [Minicystis rosea]|nr:Transcriptional regulator, AraC family protein [Minicystis rosea]